jgi:tetratricopeptide (TPR) repeat protein
MQRVASSQLLWALCLIGWLLVWPRPAALHAEPIDPPGTGLYTFGLHLFRLGDYYRAVTELKRFSLLFPDHQQYPVAQLLIGLALQEDQLYDDAWGHFQRLQQHESTTDIGRLAAFKLGELRFQQEQYRQAITHWQQFLRLFPEGPLVPHTMYLLGLALALDGQPAQAQQLLATFPRQFDLSHQALLLQQALETAPPPQQKSPRTAGLLAGVLPGAGHLYLGKPGQAITAFLLNGVFLTGAAFAFHEGLEIVGGILLYFETGWYLGNIKSAMDGAREAPIQDQKAFANALRTTYALPTLTFERLQSPSIGLRIAF